MITVQSPISDRAGSHTSRSSKMKNFLNSKAVFRIAGIIAIAALIGIALVSCASSAKNAPISTARAASRAQVTVRNTSTQAVTVTLQGGSSESAAVQAGRSKTFQVPANENITVHVLANGFSHYSSTFTVSSNGSKTLTFNGSTVN